MQVYIGVGWDLGINLVFRYSQGRPLIHYVWGPVCASVVLNSDCVNGTFGAYFKKGK